MDRQTAPLSERPLRGLTQPPHILAQLIDMILGQHQFSPFEQEHQLQHLTVCIHCQMFLGTYLARTIEYNTEYGFSTDEVRQLLHRLTQAMQETIKEQHEMLKDDIPAYVELLEERGEEEADKLFPLLAEHVQTCMDCQSAVYDLRLWLSQSAEEGWG